MKVSARNIIFGIFIWCFIGIGITDSIPILLPLKFIPDIFIVGLLVYERVYTKEQYYNPFSRYILYALLGSTLISYCLHYENIFYYIWGLKNMFRFFLYMHICIRFMRKDDFILFCNITLFFLLINTPIMFYQGAVMHLFGDNVGGLFGTTTGVNGYTNIHIVLSSIIAISLYSKKYISITYVLIILLCCFLQASLSELKFYYVEFIVIVFECFILSKEKKQLLPLVCYSIFILMIGIILINYFYPEYENFFNIDSMMYYSENSYGVRNEGLDRTTALPIIKQMFLTEPKDFLLGIGLGNAEFTRLYTPNFISNYGYFHIDNFSHAMLFLESGLIGVILYSLFFINYFISNFLQREKIQTLVGLSAIPLIFCFCIYNQSMRLDSAFFVFAFLALPYTKEIV